jgi:hypothetical protein
VNGALLGRCRSQVEDGRGFAGKGGAERVDGGLRAYGLWAKRIWCGEAAAAGLEFTAATEGPEGSVWT